MRFVLLRHGKTLANEQRLYCGWSDIGLSPAGREELLALRNCVNYPEASDLIRITSGMRRADETLRLLFGAEPDLCLADLREMNFGRFEMHSYDELRDDPDYQAWISDMDGVVPPSGGETAAGFRSRVIAAAAGIERDALVVCHGGVIAALMAHWFPGEGKNMYQWQPDHGCGYEVQWKGGLPNYRFLGPANDG